MRLVLFLVVLGCLGGCTVNAPYNPMQVAADESFLLNQGGFKAVEDGMSLEEVHKLMGDALVIGYERKSAGYQPLTIPNPYKTQVIKDTGYSIEYYIESIHQPDGVVHDDQLVPFVFKNGRLVGRGWPLVNSLGLAKTQV